MEDKTKEEILKGLKEEQQKDIANFQNMKKEGSLMVGTEPYVQLAQDILDRKKKIEELQENGKYEQETHIKMEETSEEEKENKETSLVVVNQQLTAMQWIRQKISQLYNQVKNYFGADNPKKGVLSERYKNVLMDNLYAECEDIVCSAGRKSSENKFRLSEKDMEQYNKYEENRIKETITEKSNSLLENSEEITQDGEEEEKE